MYKIPRTKGAKNKKTLLKEQESQKNKSTKTLKVEPVIEVPEVKQHMTAFRLFTLEKDVHDRFIQHISQFGDPKFYESYIVNEIMVKYINDKIKLPEPDPSVLRDYMSAYGHVGFEAGTVVDNEDVAAFKAANRLINKKTNSFIQYQYPIIVDTEVKTTMLSKGDSTSYIVNECLKAYMRGDFKIDTRDFKIKEWEPEYKYALRKHKKQSTDEF